MDSVEYNNVPRIFLFIQYKITEVTLTRFLKNFPYALKQLQIFKIYSYHFNDNTIDIFLKFFSSFLLPRQPTQSCNIFLEIEVSVKNGYMYFEI